jgi:hypothetical protein
MFNPRMYVLVLQIWFMLASQENAAFIMAYITLEWHAYV